MILRNFDFAESKDASIVTVLEQQVKQLPTDMNSSSYSSSPPPPFFVLNFHVWSKGAGQGLHGEAWLLSQLLHYSHRISEMAS